MQAELLKLGFGCYRVLTPVRTVRGPGHYIRTPRTDRCERGCLGEITIALRQPRYEPRFRKTDMAAARKPRVQPEFACLSSKFSAFRFCITYVALGHRM